MPIPDGGRRPARGPRGESVSDDLIIATRQTLLLRIESLEAEVERLRALLRTVDGIGFTLPDKLQADIDAALEGKP